jgi:hypothetical protein
MRSPPIDDAGEKASSAPVRGKSGRSVAPWQAFGGGTSVDEQSNNPQYEQMADESMVRNLEHQAKAIWPQESAIFRGYGLAVASTSSTWDAGPGK